MTKIPSPYNHTLIKIELVSEHHAPLPAWNIIKIFFALFLFMIDLIGVSALQNGQAYTLLEKQLAINPIIVRKKSHTNVTRNPILFHGTKKKIIEMLHNIAINVV